MKYETSEVGAYENANDDVSIVVHCQAGTVLARHLTRPAQRGDLQHDKVRDGELQHVQQCANGLLQKVWAIPSTNRRGTDRSRAAFSGAALGGGRQDCGFNSGLGVLPDEEAVVLLDGTAEHLKRDDEQDDAYARAGKDGIGGDLPRRGDEARVDRVPVPEHLRSIIRHG